MDFNETPVRAPGRLRFSSPRAKPLQKRNVEIAETRVADGEAPGFALLTATGDAIASFYVAVAHRVLLGVEAIEDRRAESRPAVLRSPSVTGSHAPIPKRRVTRPRTQSTRTQSKSDPT